MARVQRLLVEWKNTEAREQELLRAKQSAEKASDDFSDYVNQLAANNYPGVYYNDLQALNKKGDALLVAAGEAIIAWQNFAEARKVRFAKIKKTIDEIDQRGCRGMPVKAPSTGRPSCSVGKTNFEQGSWQALEAQPAETP